jgi:hypothetical protein
LDVPAWGKDFLKLIALKAWPFMQILRYGLAFLPEKAIFVQLTQL